MWRKRAPDHVSVQAVLHAWMHDWEPPVACCSKSCLLWRQNKFSQAMNQFWTCSTQV